MKIIIQSPIGIEDEIQGVDSLRVRSNNGYPISILSNHAPLITQVSAGFIEYKRNKDAYTIPISDSVMIVNDNVIKILTANNLLPDNI